MTWDYIAGFIDGEGSIVPKKLGYVLIISQTNFEVLEKIRLFSGCGHVYPITKRKHHWKDAWLYSSGGYKGTYHILVKTVNKLVIKQKEAKYAISVLNGRLAMAEKLKKIKKERIKSVKELRLKGYTYREIGKELGVDFGYARRLELGLK